MGFDLYGVQAVSEKGTYFRNNVWWWRRLWQLVALTCADVLTEEDIRQGEWNNGHLIEAAKAEQMAERLTSLAADEAKRRELEAATAKGLPEDYAFDWDNVREFADFCRESGGFEIC